ncbi:MAG: alkaline phosphatase [Candidatus Binatia bacterium]|nr:MAG: alkaline phosphatase [Candidatus Binatia bacterium]
MRTLLFHLLLAGLSGVAACGFPLVRGPDARARNLVVFLGDGLGVSAYTLARLEALGEGRGLVVDTFPHTALVSTRSRNGVVTDSAAAATALFAGEATDNERLGMSPCPDGSFRSPPSIAEIAARHGMATGVVTNTRVTHATPAALYAHVPHRDRELDIAAQLADHFAPDVVLGGGRALFLPSTTAAPEDPELRGAREDGRDLAAELVRRGYRFVRDRDELRELEVSPPPKILGLFAPSHLEPELTRKRSPSLVEMAEVALEALERSGKPYFLLVEGGQIDFALHANHPEAAVAEILAFDRAVGRALELVDLEDTLVVVTADHSHGLAINGYPLVASDSELRQALSGSAGVDAFGKPYPVVTFSTGPGGFESRPPGTAPAFVPLEWGAHSGEDVFLAARGARSELFGGFLPNRAVFSLFLEALGLPSGLPEHEGTTCPGSP